MRRRVALGLLVGFNLGLFAWTVWIRAPWFGRISPGENNGTAAALKFARQWYAEGAVSLRFAMIENPRSVEFADLAEREPYVSYPPGAILPIHLVGLVAGEPTARLVMGYNLGNQFLVALLVSITVFLLLTQAGLAPPHALALSAGSSAVYLTLPGPLYWHQHYWFADTAVMLPFALILFCEAMRDEPLSPWGRRVAAGIQSAALAVALLTDWLGLFVLLALYSIRLARRRLPRSRDHALFWTPALVAGVLFGVQLLAIGGGLRGLWAKLAARTDWGSTASGFVREFWLSSVPTSLGGASVPLLVGAAILLGWRIGRRNKGDEAETRLLSMAALALLPGLVQTAFFMQHSTLHDFAALKLAIPLAIIPFALAPVLLIRRFAPRDLDSRPGLIVTSIAALTALYVGVELPRALDRFVAPGSGIAAVPSSLGEAVRRHARYEDVLFSPDFQIPSYPSWTLCHSMKRVYPAASPDEIRDRSGRIPRPHRSVLLFLDPPDAEWTRRLGGGAKPIASESVDVLGPGGPKTLRFYELPPGF